MYMISEGTLLPTQNILQKFRTEVFPEDFDPEFEYDDWDSDQDDTWFSPWLGGPFLYEDEEVFERPHERYSARVLEDFNN